MYLIREIIPAQRYDNRPANDVLQVTDPDLLGGPQTRKVYRARRGGEPVAVIIETVAPNGYSGPIALLVGVFADGTLAGVRITAHRETAGLGDRIELDESDWVLSFAGTVLGTARTARGRYGKMAASSTNLPVPRSRRARWYRPCVML